MYAWRMGNLVRLATALILTLASAAGPDASHSAFQKGLKLKKGGKFAAAAKIFERLAEKDPEDAASLEQLATLQGWLKRYDEAIGTWQKALRLEPKSPDFHLGLSRVLYWREDLKGAASEALAATKLDPKRADAWLFYGDVLLAQNQGADARKAYETARALAPDDPEPAQKLARLQQSK